MRKQIIASVFLIIIASAIVSATSSNQVPTNCSGQFNTQPVLETEPTLINQVPNGQKYSIPYDDRAIHILNLTGSSYEMGYAYGQLLKEELGWILDNFFPYVANEIQGYLTILKKLPSFAQKLTGKALVGAIKVVLNLNYVICKRYIPQRFDDEMQGIADATGLDIWDIRGVQMFPELIKAACSMLGVWGPASDTGKLYQLRALDFDVNMPIGQYPTVTVYHSTEEGSVPFANIGWAGSIGTITGYGMYAGVSEKQGNLSDSDTTRFGKPWTFALRDTLQFTKTIDESLENLRNTKRTCSIYIGLGSKTNNTFRIITEDEDMFDAYDDHTWYPIFSDPGSPQMDGIIYKVMHNTFCFKNMLLPNYGHIDAELIRQTAAADLTGDAQLAIFDYLRNYIYLSYPIWNQSIPAYTRPSAKINLNPFFTGSPNYEE